MPIGGKDAFLSKVTFRRESKWYSKTKQELKDMETIEERAKLASKGYDDDGYSAGLYMGYKVGAIEQKEIDEEVRLKKCDDMTKEEYDREEAFALWYAKQGKGTPAFSDAIEWARKEIINKACEWLKENVEGGVHPQSSYGFVNKFRKVMEE